MAKLTIEETAKPAAKSYAEAAKSNRDPLSNPQKYR